MFEVMTKKANQIGNTFDSTNDSDWSNRPLFFLLNSTSSQRSLLAWQMSLI